MLSFTLLFLFVASLCHCRLTFFLIALSSKQAGWLTMKVGRRGIHMTFWRTAFLCPLTSFYSLAVFWLRDYDLSTLEQVDGRLLAALRVLFTRSKKEMEGKTATELSRYKVCNKYCTSPSQSTIVTAAPRASMKQQGRQEPKCAPGTLSWQFPVKR